MMKNDRRWVEEHYIRDLKLRNPIVHKTFQMCEEQGLSEVETLRKCVINLVSENEILKDRKVKELQNASTSHWVLERGMSEEGKKKHLYGKWGEPDET